MRKNDVDIGVIYTHERQFMNPLLTSLSRSGSGLRMRLILVDNASDEGVGEWKRIFPQTRVLRNVSRLGYAPNLNRILSVSKARYVLLLNTDMYFEPDEQSVARMVRFMDDHPDCGVSNCRLLHADGSDAYPARRFQTLSTILARRLFLGRFMRSTLDSYLYKDHPRDAVLDCDWLSGCFLMIRQEAIRKVGRFDCRFPMYFEDVDLCLRMALAGWRVMYNGQTHAYHLEQRASKAILSRPATLHLQSYLRWLSKWGFSPEQYLTTVPRLEEVVPRSAKGESPAARPELVVLRPTTP